MFILGIFVSILICGWKGMMAGDFEHLYIFFFALIFGGIGFLDDFEKVKHKQNLGLTAIQKFLLQLAAAVAFLCLMRFEGMLTPNLYVPFFNTQIVMSWWVYMVFAAFVIVGTVNAVNLTDGLDGLASCVKHFAAYGLVEAGQDYGHVDVSRVEMYNTYLPPFKAALDAGCDMLMPAFTPVDRVPATANRWLMRDLLRDELGFGGFVVTDYGTIARDGERARQIVEARR